MEATFWHKKWETNEIGFHEKEYNPGLTRHFGGLNLPSGSRVFVPLCGKTRDIHWLLKEGFKVVGAELSELAVKQLFEELQTQPAVEDTADGKIYTAPGIQVFTGDIFQLTGNSIGRIDGIYDRAALVALPDPMRKKYTEHLRTITDTAPQLVITFTYDQAHMDGPPFSVPAAEIETFYAPFYQLKQVQDSEVKGGLKGQCEARNNVWQLTKKD